LEIWDSTQAPIPIRNGLAAMFGLAQTSVRVVAPDVGGGFGPKVMMFYPEEILVPLAAQRLGRPVKWIEDRREHFVATNQEREQIHDAEIALDETGRILGVRTVFLYDAGAYCPYGLIVPIVAGTTLPGPYRVPNYHCEFTAVFTNKTPVSPYRGAGIWGWASPATSRAPASGPTKAAASPSSRPARCSSRPGSGHRARAI